MYWSRGFFGAAAAPLLCSATIVAAAACSQTTLPTLVEGPITGGTRGHPFSAYVGNISDIGYVEEEYFIGGAATRYGVSGNLTIDGKWSLFANNTGNYKTRILVRRPKDRSKFNGDVIIEWINVSFGIDLVLSDHPGVYEAGYVFVGVSAQFTGLTGQGANPIGMNIWDPVRYGTLNIPDDALSYDIFTQAANLLRSGKVLGGLRPKKIIGVGESQSGSRVLGYINGVQPISNAFDGIINVICAGNAADFSPAPAHPNQNDHGRTIPTFVRDDLKIPVFSVNTETESGFYVAAGLRQPDTAKFVEWEIAGASHANAGILRDVIAVTTRDNVPSPLGSIPATNVSYIDWRPTVDAVYRHVSAWVRNPRLVPPTVPKLLAVNNTANGIPVLQRDSDGNTIGGVRVPEETVPIASYNAANNGLAGNTYFFSGEKLKQLYPTHRDYVGKVSVAAAKAVADGFILGYKAKEYIENAQAVNVPPS